MASVVGRACGIGGCPGKGVRQGVRRHRSSVGGWKGGACGDVPADVGVSFFFRRRKTIGLVRTVSDQSDNVIIAINFVDRMVQILWICLSGLFNSSGDDKM